GRGGPGDKGGEDRAGAREEGEGQGGQGQEGKGYESERQGDQGRADQAQGQGCAGQAQVRMRAALAMLLALGLLAAPLTGNAQQRGKTWRVGFLSGGARAPDGAPPPVFRQALK